MRVRLDTWHNYVLNCNGKNTKILLAPFKKIVERKNRYYLIKVEKGVVRRLRVFTEDELCRLADMLSGDEE